MGGGARQGQRAIPACPNPELGVHGLADFCNVVSLGPELLLFLRSLLLKFTTGRTGLLSTRGTSSTHFGNRWSARP